MAKYFIAKMDTVTFRLRVEIGDETAHFLFMYFENSYKILTYAFLPKEATQAQVQKTVGGWQEVSEEKARPILETGMQEWTALMQVLKQDS